MAKSVNLSQNIQEKMKSFSKERLFLILKDSMLFAASRNKIAAFLFTGIIGKLFFWGLGFVVEALVEQGFDLGTMKGFKFFQKENRIAFEKDLKENYESAPTIDKELYKSNARKILSKFFDLSRFFKSK